MESYVALALSAYSFARDIGLFILELNAAIAAHCGDPAEVPPITYQPRTRGALFAMVLLSTW